MNRENLEKIAAHTEKRDQARFDMMSFCVKQNGNEIYPKESINVCNTVTSIIGDCPNIKGLEPLEGESWGEYSYRITGLHAIGYDWVYLFGVNWARTDNTTKGAAKRIRYYLEHGLPESWFGQMVGTMPLSYKKESVPRIRHHLGWFS